KKTTADATVSAEGCRYENMCNKIKNLWQRLQAAPLPESPAVVVHASSDPVRRAIGLNMCGLGHGANRKGYQTSRMVFCDSKGLPTLSGSPTPKNWSQLPGSNRRPAVYETAA